LKVSSGEEIGGIKIGFVAAEESSDDFPVELNESGQAFVNVPVSEYLHCENGGTVSGDVTMENNFVHFTDASSLELDEGTLFVTDGTIHICNPNASSLVEVAVNEGGKLCLKREVPTDIKTSIEVEGVSIESETPILNIVNGEVHAAAFYETSDIRKKDIKSDLSLDKCYDVIDKCQTIIYSLKD
jgi:hypothetical protein